MLSHPCHPLMSDVAPGNTRGTSDLFFPISSTKSTAVCADTSDDAARLIKMIATSCFVFVMRGKSREVITVRRPWPQGQSAGDLRVLHPRENTGNDRELRIDAVQETVQKTGIKEPQNPQ